MRKRLQYHKVFILHCLNFDQNRGEYTSYRLEWVSGIKRHYIAHKFFDWNTGHIVKCAIAPREWVTQSEVAFDCVNFNKVFSMLADRDLLVVDNSSDLGYAE